MALPVSGMLAAGSIFLLLGFILARTRIREASGIERLLVLGPIFEATALAIFAAEHFLLARGLATIVPPWLPWPLFWTYLFGIALLAAALSFVTGRAVRWSSSLLALFFFIIVATIHLPNLIENAGDRLFWNLVARELFFAGGALVLAGSEWPNRALIRSGRIIVAAVLLLYGLQHFLFIHYVPGVPLNKLTPAWMPAASLITAVIGAIEIIAAPLLLIPRTIRSAASFAGMALVALVVSFYVPILIVDLHTETAIEGVNYVGDTLLFAATLLLSGLEPPDRLRRGVSIP